MTTCVCGSFLVSPEPSVVMCDLDKVGKRRDKSQDWVKHYECGINQRRVVPTLKQFSSPDLQTLNASAFMRMLGGKRIMLLGDSLSWQQAAQLKCALLNQGVPAAVVEDTVKHEMSRYLLSIPLPAFRASKRCDDDLWCRYGQSVCSFHVIFRALLPLRTLCFLLLCPPPYVFVFVVCSVCCPCFCSLVLFHSLCV